MPVIGKCIANEWVENGFIFFLLFHLLSLIDILIVRKLSAKCAIKCEMVLFKDYS